MKMNAYCTMKLSNNSRQIYHDFKTIFVTVNAIFTLTFTHAKSNSDAVAQKMPCKCKWRRGGAGEVPKSYEILIGQNKKIRG